MFTADFLQSFLNGFAFGFYLLLQCLSFHRLLIYIRIDARLDAQTFKLIIFMGVNVIVFIHNFRAEKYDNFVYWNNFILFCMVNFSTTKHHKLKVFRLQDIAFVLICFVFGETFCWYFFAWFSLRRWYHFQRSCHYSKDGKRGCIVLLWSRNVWELYQWRMNLCCNQDLQSFYVFELSNVFEFLFDSKTFCPVVSNIYGGLCSFFSQWLWFFSSFWLEAERAGHLA